MALSTYRNVCGCGILQLYWSVPAGIARVERGWPRGTEAEAVRSSEPPQSLGFRWGHVLCLHFVLGHTEMLS